MRAQAADSPSFAVVSFLGPSVHLQGPALLDVAQLLELGIREVRSRDGIQPPPRLLALQREVNQAADAFRMSRAGHGDIPSSGDPSGSLCGQGLEARPARHIGSREAAVIVGVSVRQLRRLADEIGVITRRPSMVFDRDAVVAFAASRGTHLEEK